MRDILSFWLTKLLQEKKRADLFVSSVMQNNLEENPPSPNGVTNLVAGINLAVLWLCSTPGKIILLARTVTGILSSVPFFNKKSEHI